MTTLPHKHSQISLVVRDVIIGMSDGLTVPFALAAGLTGALAAAHLVVTAGLAEIAAGSISMGLGGYLAAQSDVEHYLRERAVEEQEVQEIPAEEKQEIRDFLGKYGVSKTEAEPVVRALAANPKAWVDFMMLHELGLEKPDPLRARKSAATIAASYVVGGFVPLAPYFFVAQAHDGLRYSIGLTLLALVTFGYFKARVSGTNAWRSALRTLIVGGIAAGAAYALARLIS